MWEVTRVRRSEGGCRTGGCVALWSSLWSLWPPGPFVGRRPRSVGVTVLGQLARRVRGQRSDSGLSAEQRPMPRPSWPRPALGAGADGAQIAGLMVAYTESSLENLGPESGNDGSPACSNSGQRGVGGPRRGTGPDRCRRHVRRAALERSKLAEHGAVGGGARRAGLGLQRSAVCVQPRFVGGRRQLQGELDPGRHDLGGYHRVGGQLGLRRGRTAASRPARRAPSDCPRATPSHRTPHRLRPLPSLYAISKLGDAYVWGARGRPVSTAAA